jgi:hypothetical protein
MKIQQLSIFLENRPGQMAEPCRLLAVGDVSIRTLTMADTERFGILRLIVADWQKARQILEDAGYIVNVTEVLAVEVSDHPGGLAGLLATLKDTDLNIEYMYAFTFGREDRAVLIFRFADPDAAGAKLQAAGVNLLDGVEVYNPIPK